MIQEGRNLAINATMEKDNVVIEENNEEESLSLITDSEILDKVFDEYYKLLERNNINY